jgi:acyl-CoA hydrolase
MNDPADGIFRQPDQIADAIIGKVGKRIVLALPLGLGKANHIANALYARAVADRSIQLTIFTGLTLMAPRAKSDLERRFLDPLSARLFADYPPLHYAMAIHSKTLPPNVEVDEFFFLAGQWLNSPYAQQHYTSANYTHALRYVVERGVNVVAQLVAHDAGRPKPYSVSCNTDLTLDLLAMRKRGEVDFVFTGQVNSELPFMGGAAALEKREFDALLDSPETDFALFAPPREPVALADYAAGLHAASLVPDGGTLQIGIGSLGDAVARSLVLRHRDNAIFLRALQSLGGDARNTGLFKEGLYGCTEMLVEGLLDLFNEGVLKREVDGAVLHGGFFVGSRSFYRALREMPENVRDKFRMTAISYVNELFGAEDEKRRARVKARFINDAMMVTLLGDVVSDALEDGRVVSGVGGQYNFVAQAFALADARAIIMLRSTRTTGGKTQSNIRWRYGHTTIPRHLRDIVVTEYGIADLRGKSDRDVIAAMLSITDSRFQGELLRQAKDAKKIEVSFALESRFCENYPEIISGKLNPFLESLPAFPFGTDFTPEEQRLLPALERLKGASPTQLAQMLFSGWISGTNDLACMARLELAKPRSWKEWSYANLVKGAMAGRD